MLLWPFRRPAGVAITWIPAGEEVRMPEGDMVQSVSNRHGEREREKFIYHVRTKQIHIQVRQW